MIAAASTLQPTTTRQRIETISAFLRERMAEADTVAWALTLTHNDMVQKQAVLSVLQYSAPEKEPWRTAWRMIEEYWSSCVTKDGRQQSFSIQRRLCSGDRSGSLVAELTDLVRPRLEISAFSEQQVVIRGVPKTPRKVQHLFHAGITSNRLDKITRIDFEQVNDVAFLRSLARSLEGAVDHGLDIIRRLGRRADAGHWALGGLHRVYFVVREDGEDADRDPDLFCTGLAPSVKMLHAVARKLADLAPDAAAEVLHRWAANRTAVYIRLWAALTCDSDLVSGDAIAAFLTNLSADQFWDIHEYPEVAELRALRFSDLSHRDQLGLIKRVKKRPPRSQWGKQAEPERIEQARLFWALRELLRIQGAGGQLPPPTQDWIDARIGEFPELTTAVSLDAGFSQGVVVQSVVHEPGEEYDVLIGAARLDALETNLKTIRDHWEEDPAGRAGAWITKDSNVLLVVADLEGLGDGGREFPKVWEKLGWSYGPETVGASDSAMTRETKIADATRVLELLHQLPSTTISSAIEGITWWLSVWDSLLPKNKKLFEVWQKIWPLAVEATNQKVQPDFDETDLGLVAHSMNDDDPMDLDTLNSPAGHLVGVFIAFWSSTKSSRPFSSKLLREMRDTIIEAEGRAGLIVRHRLTELLAFFHNAAPGWTKSHLLPPLVEDTAMAIPLWRALGRRRIHGSVIALLVEPIMFRITDTRLGRTTRKSLMFSIVVETLHAFRVGRDVPIPLPRLEQLLRSVEDEIRAHAADAVQRFVRDNVRRSDNPPEQSAEDLFRGAAKRFLQEVWPQERSLSTPGISQAFADLPAACGEAFAEVVATVERFLVPFACWSMLEYGFYGDDDESRPKLSKINSPEKVRALLTLFDRTIGVSDDVVPYDLANALTHIRSIDPSLAATPEFRRLAARARVVI